MSRHKFKKPNVRPATFTWTPELLEVVTGELGLEHISPHELEQAAHAVKKLSDRFLEGSVSKGGISEIYGDDPAHLMAYSAYFLLANVPKIVEVIHNLSLNDSLEKSTDSLKILDLGTGPGTAVIGTLIAMAESVNSNKTGQKARINVTAVDHSQRFLSSAERLISAFRDHLKLPGESRFLKNDLVKLMECKNPRVVLNQVLGTGYDLIILSNAMAELPETTLEIMPGTLELWMKPGATLFMMEPAQRVPGRRLLAIRDRLCEMGWHVRYPCPGNAPCPALKRPRDWCHHRLKWQPPYLVKRMDELTGMHKNLLNFSPVVMTKPGECSTGNVAVDGQEDENDTTGKWYRVVSEVRPQKGKLEVTLCGEFDSETAMKTCQLENKRVSRYNNLFPELARYDRIRIENADNRKERLILSETSRLTLDD